MGLASLGTPTDRRAFYRWPRASYAAVSCETIEIRLPVAIVLRFGAPAGLGPLPSPHDDR